MLSHLTPSAVSFTTIIKATRLWTNVTAIQFPMSHVCDARPLLRGSEANVAPEVWQTSQSIPSKWLQKIHPNMALNHWMVGFLENERPNCSGCHSIKMVYYLLSSPRTAKRILISVQNCAIFAATSPVWIASSYVGDRQSTWKQLSFPQLSHNTQLYIINWKCRVRWKTCGSSILQSLAYRDVTVGHEWPAILSTPPPILAIWVIGSTFWIDKF